MVPCTTNDILVALQPLFAMTNPNYLAINAKLPESVVNLLPAEELERVQARLVDNVLDRIRSGHWNDLAGARELMKKLGITRLEFPAELHQLITSFLIRIPYQDQWVSIANSQSGPYYPDEQGYANEAEVTATKRKKLITCLQRIGYAEEEINEELLQNVLLLRELMIVLAGMKTRPKEIISLLSTLELS